MKVVIFCGGHGTRFWPLRRNSFSKPFIPFIDGKSLVQITYERYRKAFPASDILISTEEKYLKYLKDQLPEVSNKNIILEPERRDTLPAYGLVAVMVNKFYPGEPVLFSWAKHVIRKEKTFLDIVKASGEYTKETGIGISIDSTPDYPSIYNGWIKKGNSITEIAHANAYELVQQIEKPELTRAKKMFISDNYLLHTGNTVWNVEKLLGYMQEYQPALYKGLNIIADSWGTKHYSTELYREYHKFEKITVDYGLLEKIPKGELLTVEADIGWEDVGISWESFRRGLAEAENSNVEQGGSDTEYIEAESNLVIGPKNKLIAIIGLSDIGVIDTPDGLLVCKLSESQKVKPLYEKIEKERRGYVD